MKKIIITLIAVLFAFSMFAATAKKATKHAKVAPTAVATTIPTPVPTPTPLSFMAKVKVKIKKLLGMEPVATAVPVATLVPAPPVKVVPVKKAK